MFEPLVSKSGKIIPDGRQKATSTRNEKGEIQTRNEWRRWKITLETGGEDLKLHSKRVEKM